MNEFRLLTPRQAADRIGISYPALKHWILAGRMRTIKTPGGHHRVPVDALYEFLADAKSGPSVDPGFIGNKLVGTVLEIAVDGLAAKVILEIENQQITAIITADEARQLSLRRGESATALIKSTSVMIGLP